MSVAVVTALAHLLRTGIGGRHDLLGNRCGPGVRFDPGNVPSPSSHRPLSPRILPGFRCGAPPAAGVQTARPRTPLRIIASRCAGDSTRDCAYCCDWLAVSILHHEVRQPLLVLPPSEQTCDVQVIQAGENLPLGDEALHPRPAAHGRHGSV